MGAAPAGGRERDVRPRRRRWRLGRIRSGQRGCRRELHQRCVRGGRDDEQLGDRGLTAFRSRHHGGQLHRHGHADGWHEGCELCAAQPRRYAAQGDGRGGGERVGSCGHALPDPVRGSPSPMPTATPSRVWSSPSRRRLGVRAEPSSRSRSGRARVVRVRTNTFGIAVAPVFTANRAQGGYIVEGLDRACS